MPGQITGFGAAVGVIVALLGWRIWTAFKPRNSWLDQPVVFFFLVFAALLALRLPQIAWRQEINADESQMLAQGLRYLSHPVPWRDVDGTTSGPLNSWLLSGPMIFGAPASWALARTMLWAAQCATLIFIYLAVRCFASRPEAQLALMPTIFFYAFALEHDSTHYSSETLPVLLMCVMVWLLCRAWATGKFSDASMFAVGFLAGCIPFAKLQASPMAALLAVMGLAQIIFLDRKNCWRKAGWLCLGVAVVPALLLGIVAASGAARDFWISYILSPAAYTQESFKAKAEALWVLFTARRDFRSYFISALACGILLAAARVYARRAKMESKLLVPLTAICALGVTAVFCMLEAGKGFGHYLVLLIPAQAVFFGLALVAGKDLLRAREENERRRFLKPVTVFVAVFAVIMCVQVEKAPRYFNTMRSVLAHWPPNRKSFVARRIIKASQPSDALSVWGWMPAWYVETGLMPATRDAIGHFIIKEGPYRDYYRQRYINDLEQSRPAIFVDAMAEGVFTPTWPELTPHEALPELGRFIGDNYSLWLSVHLITARGVGVPVRIYLRKERMAELKLKPEELNIPLDPALAPE